MKDAVLKALAADLDEADQQMDRAGETHAEKVDELVAFHAKLIADVGYLLVSLLLLNHGSFASILTSARVSDPYFMKPHAQCAVLRQLKSEFSIELAEVQKEFQQERAAIIEQHEKELAEIKDIQFAMNVSCPLHSAWRKSSHRMWQHDSLTKDCPQPFSDFFFFLYAFSLLSFFIFAVLLAFPLFFSYISRLLLVTMKKIGQLNFLSCLCFPFHS